MPGALTAQGIVDTVLGMRRLRPSRAMTLIEVIVTLTIIITLSLFLARSFTGTNKSLSLQNAGLRLAAAQVAVRDKAQANLFEVPAVFSDVDVKGTTLVTDRSDDSDHISVRWISSTRYSMAIRFNGGCLVMVDDLDTAEQWAVDLQGEDNCLAPSSSELLSATLGDTPAEAGSVDLAG